jgi:hypothetical protein
MAAVGETAMPAVPAVALVIVVLFTVTPAPKFAAVFPFTQFVDKPVRVIVLVWPCASDVGLMELSDAGGEAIVKLLPAVAVSPRVVKVTEFTCALALAAMVTFAVAEVELFTVSVLTEIPCPNPAIVTPCEKWVLTPAIATLKVWPCSPEFGLRVVRAAVP